MIETFETAMFEIVFLNKIQVKWNIDDLPGCLFKEEWTCTKVLGYNAAFSPYPVDCFVPLSLVRNLSIYFIYE